MKPHPQQSGKMRPHTRTQCQERPECKQCHKQPPLSSKAALSPPSVSDLFHSTSSIIKDADSDNSSTTSSSCCVVLGEEDHGGDKNLFLMPPSQGSSRGVSTRSSHQSHMSSNMSSVSTADNMGMTRPVMFTELPMEVLHQIMEFLSFKEVSHSRLISRRFNEICSSILNTTFKNQEKRIQERLDSCKVRMPRRESARRNHPLSREYDILDTMMMRFSLLNMTFGKYIDRKYICFFPGDILDEVASILRNMSSNTTTLGRLYKVTDELHDLSTMAIEHFKDNIAKTLPENTMGYEGYEVWRNDSVPPIANPAAVASPSKLRGGNMFGTSPGSSRASVVGSSVSDNSDFDVDSKADVNKRFRKVRTCMKRTNSQVVGLKHDVTLNGQRIDAQTKTVSAHAKRLQDFDNRLERVAGYSKRLQDYDKKFDENSRTMKLMMEELNKCKSEIKYWRAKSAPFLQQQQQQQDSASPPGGSGLSCSCAEAAGSPSSGSGNSLDEEAGSNSSSSDHEVFPPKSPAEATAAAEEQQQQPQSRPATRGSLSGPPSPAPVPCGAASRKRRANTVTMEEEVTRKSLRGAGTRAGAKKALQNASKVL